MALNTQLISRHQKEQLIEGHKALLSPHWPLYLGESDDLVDLISPRIIEVEPTPVKRIHSIIPELEPGCRLVKVPNRIVKQDKSWYVEQQLYSIPPEKNGIQLSKPKLAYTIEEKEYRFQWKFSVNQIKHYSDIPATA